MTWLALTLSVYAALMCAAATCYAVWYFTCGRAVPDEPDGEQVAQDFLEQQAQSSHGEAVERLQREGEEAMLKSAKPYTNWGQAWPYDGQHASASTDTSAIPQVDS